MRILVTGDRNWTDKQAIKDALLEHKATHVIHGACRGADHLADQVARELLMNPTACPADWDAHGRAAGPIRNREMLKNYKPELVLAFHDCIWKSKGTFDCVTAALDEGIKVELYAHGPPRREPDGALRTPVVKYWPSYQGSRLRLLLQPKLDQIQIELKV